MDYVVFPIHSTFFLEKKSYHRVNTGNEKKNIYIYIINQIFRTGFQRWSFLTRNFSAVYHDSDNFLWARLICWNLPDTSRFCNKIYLRQVMQTTVLFKFDNFYRIFYIFIPVLIFAVRRTKRKHYSLLSISHLLILRNWSENLKENHGILEKWSYLILHGL